MLTSYHPEMGEKQAEGVQIEARLSHYGKHWFLDTYLTLNGRGIVYVGTETDVRSAHAGRHKYKVTEKAFDRLCQQYHVSTEMLL